MKHIGYAALALLATISIGLSADTFANSTTVTTATNATPTDLTLTAEAPSNTAVKPSGRLWNLQDADILSVINEVSLETGKNFVVDPRVSGKISLVSSKPIKPSEVYQVFLSVLGLLGYSAIPSGNIIKIVPNMESPEMATHVATSSSPGNGDEVVVRIIALKNTSAAQLLPVIRPMLPQWSNISAYMPGNTLIVVGHASNIQRILDVIDNIDTSSGNSIEMIPLHQASASQVATVLNNLQNAARANGDATAVSIAADERSNSILLGGARAARLHIRALIAQLDGPVTTTQGNTDVIYLKYLEAKTFAPILGKIAQNISKSGGNAVDTSVNSVNLTGAIASSNGGKKDEIPNDTNIQAEPSVNALIITAPPSLLRSLKTIVAKLDIRPAQVMVEAVIVELDESDLKNMGIQWGARTDGSNPDQQPSGAAATSVSFPPLGEGTLGIIPHTQIRAVLSLLANKTGVNILSTPSVVVLDNQKATLKVGQDVPYQTGSYASSGAGITTATPYNTVSSKPVVLELNVTPQINLGSAVRLKLDLRNDTLQNPDNPTLNPIINTSQITNNVIVNSCDILVIGGLISRNITESTDKIPFLGDIPGVGLLFQHKRHTVEKKTLVAFIKPTIIYNGDQATDITYDKYIGARQAQIDWPGKTGSEGQQKIDNVIPLWNNNVKLPQPFAQ